MHNKQTLQSMRQLMNAARVLLTFLWLAGLFYGIFQWLDKISAREGFEGFLPMLLILAILAFLTILYHFARTAMEDIAASHHTNLTQNNTLYRLEKELVSISAQLHQEEEQA